MSSNASKSPDMKILSSSIERLNQHIMSDNTYESKQLLNEYLLFHYGRPEEVLPYVFGPTSALAFPARCVTECVNADSLPTNARALDIGCAVGRSTFELARICEEVIGIDYSHAFVNAGNVLVREGQLAYERLEEGRVSTPCEAIIDPLIDRSRLQFEHGNAQSLRSDLGVFDLVLACNLICRLPEPMKFLQRLPELVKGGGRLIITTPFTWLEAYTLQANWLGGVEAMDSFSGLSDALVSFDLVEVKDMPFLIREHARKFQWSVAQASIWTRKL